MGRKKKFGFTCESCPSEGYYGDEDDWVRVGVPEPIYEPVESSRGTLSRIVGYSKQKWVNLTYPERCKKCNARYNAYKRARESISRLEIIRKTFHEFGGEKWKYLKFVTLTFPIKISGESREEAINRIDKKYRKKREKLAKILEVQGGTDVLECVSREITDSSCRSTSSGDVANLESHNVHYHGVWLMPKHPIQKISEAMNKCGFGRDQVRAIKEKNWVDDFGYDRIQSADRVAAEYLAKYISKENTHKRRKVWGELRKWKEYLDDEICRICVKTTHDIEKQYPCNCESNPV